jgi:hypothetical protein
MQEFMRKFTHLNGESGKVLLEHCLFDKQVFYCDVLQTIEDDDRIGLVLKGHDIFMYKHQLQRAKACDNLYILSDGKLTITVIVNKL